MKPHLTKYKHGWQCEYLGVWGIGLTPIQAYREVMRNTTYPYLEHRHETSHY